MDKHTPGEWGAFRQTCGGWFIAPNMFEFNAGQTTLLATMTWGPNAMWDAMLMCSAPKLLAAVDALLLIAPTATPEEYNIVAEARQVAANARGE